MTGVSEYWSTDHSSKSQEKNAYASKMTGISEYWSTDHSNKSEGKKHMYLK